MDRDCYDRPGQETRTDDEEAWRALNQGLKHQDDVVTFHRMMDIPVAMAPSMLTPERGDLHCQLIEEEAREFLEAIESGDWLAMVDALADLLYVIYGTTVEMGVDLSPFFDEVHAANMGKIAAADGGKSLKPEGWTPPHLMHVFRRVYGDLPIPDRDSGQLSK